MVHIYNTVTLLFEVLTCSCLTETVRYECILIVWTLTEKIEKFMLKDFKRAIRVFTSLGIFLRI